MPEFVFAYHGGSKPETEEEAAKVMAEWGAWIAKHAAQMPTPGNPVGMSKTVTAAGVEDNGGSNPLSGYSIVSTPDMDAAIAVAKDCPHIAHGGSIEIAPIIEMPLD